ncbi:hypothetical protein O6H91_14G039900 [Diphasiastrum complanatum]|uniref:Uncharacterized protein n=1 Tax=Diphasiastrum complanatum TaxID=34168 RepID=A0ACC2BNH1_DIPCM|nr:hypothetical protein O6H91_14G039900 [Diphasiastrum complanatum]
MAPRTIFKSGLPLLRSVRHFIEPCAGTTVCADLASPPIFKAAAIPSLGAPHSCDPNFQGSRNAHIGFRFGISNGGSSADTKLLGGPTRRTLFMEASSEPVMMQTLEDADSGIVTLILNRPEAKNAIGLQLLEKLQFFLKTLHEDSSSRVMLICSSVQGVFCAGADLKERRKMDEAQIHKYVNNLRSTFKFLEVLPIPTIAVIEGAALGGGLELALSCDLRVCGAEAIFALPETSLAIIPGAGGTQRLPRLVGRSRAKDLIFTSRRIYAEEATSIGLVDHCVAAGDAYVKALEIARVILRQGPLGIKMAKLAINQGMEMDSSAAMSIEEECYLQVLHTKDRLEGLDAFAQKRTPIYHGN